ncbi:hypothetical protein RQM59_06260 [Flavobacteriaceae bacterium S356]|uniref:DUF3221 domain-containing protein n=1 Tax=Asprobacillus argus TaxID=3076534 RepID=A0ABU3LE41_9FLAO|nr:hypothetical protein [Flavobacteriaceae bacterium S356]
MKSFLKVTIVLLIISSCDYKEIRYNEKKIVQTGKELINGDYSSDSAYIIVGHGLIQKIKDLNFNSQNSTFEVRQGDLKKPYGDGKATAILVIKNKKASLAIRIRLNSIDDKHYIIGWMTLK